jgi:hypothetical protein
MNDENIKKTIEAIRNSSDTSNVLKNKYQSFYEKYPTLFTCACDKNFDMKHLDWMLNKSHTLSENSSADQIKEADAEVYNVLKKCFNVNL